MMPESNICVEFEQLCGSGFAVRTCRTDAAFYADFSGKNRQHDPMLPLTGETAL
jgi:hypothetical protein